MSDFASSLPVRTENNGDAVVEICDGTTTSQKLAVDASGRITTKMDDGSGNAITSQANGGQRALDVGIDVSGVQIDPRQIRALTSADVVTANQGTANTATNGWPVKPTDGTNSQSFTAAGEAKVSVTQPLPAGTNTIGSVKVTDGTNTAAVTALGEVKVITTNDSVIKAQLQDNSGTAITLGQKVMASSVPVVIASDQSPISVVIAASLPGTNINSYQTSSALAAGANVNLDYSVTATKTFYGRKFWASASGKIKMIVQTSPDGTTFSTFWVGFNSTATPNISVDLDLLAITDTGTGAKIRINITNEDKQAFDVYATISGTEQ